MIRDVKSKIKVLALALLTAGSLSLVEASQAEAKTVVVRPGDRVVYRYPVRRDDGWWRDRAYYRYDPPAPARWQGPPPWAASWDRSRHWRDRDDWREGRNNYWRLERRARD